MWNNMEKIFSVAIDGPAGAGKSTVAKAAAAELGAMYLDTGAMYRAIGLHFIRAGRLNDDAAIEREVQSVDLSVRFEDGMQRMYLGNEDVTTAIRTPEASMAASRVGTVAAVRRHLVHLQQEIAKGVSVIMDGRDIGTAVLPNATLKIYLTASAEVRAIRRYNEMRGKGEKPVYHEVLDDIIERDYNDSHRTASPLMRADDAVLLDSSSLTVQQTLDEIKRLLAERV